MREFVFTIEYERGADPVMDVFIDHSTARSRTISCHVSAEGLWRLDQITGPEAALDRLDDTFIDPVHCNECIGERHCHTNWEYEMLSSAPTCRLVYTYRPAGSDCWSIPHLASCYLGDGLICHAERRGNRYEWRLLLCDDAPAGDLYDALRDELRDGLTLGFQQVGDPSYWIDDAVAIAELPPEQRADRRGPRARVLSDPARNLANRSCHGVGSSAVDAPVSAAAGRSVDCSVLLGPIDTEPKVGDS